MTEPERRRADRHPVDLPGTLFLTDSRRVEVQIKNIGELGALVQVGDLEEPVFEGERAVLEHPLYVDGAVSSEIRRTPAAIVRVDLEFLEDGVTRELAVYFDGGAAPDGYEAGDG